MAKAYTIRFEWPAGERQKIVESITFQADGLVDFSRGANGGISVWERFESRLRSRHRKTFDAMKDPVNNTTWTPVLEAYAKTKPPGTQNRTLYRTGTMRRALTTPQGSGHVSIRKPQSLTWGVDLGQVYPIRHQAPSPATRYRKDGGDTQRRFLGMRLPDDLLELRKIIQTDLVARWVAKGGKVQ